MTSEQTRLASCAQLGAVDYIARWQSQRPELSRCHAERLRNVFGLAHHLGGHVAIRPVDHFVDEDRSGRLPVFVERDLAYRAVKLKLVQSFLELRLPVRQIAAGSFESFYGGERGGVIAQAEQRR